MAILLPTMAARVRIIKPQPGQENKPAYTMTILLHSITQGKVLQLHSDMLGQEEFTGSTQLQDTVQQHQSVKMVVLHSRYVSVRQT